MEELQGTRTWRKKTHGPAAVARSAFDDGFGGIPRHAAPFSVMIEDYSEVFGAAASVSSIPVLNLPPADDGFDATGNYGRRGRLDYSEIFGGFGDGGFAVSYEELFAGSKRSGISSMDRRASWGVLSEEQAIDDTVHSLEGYSKDHVVNLEMGQLSMDKHLDDVSSKQFSVSSQKIIDDVVSAETHAAKLDAIPGFTVVVDVNDPPHVMKSKAVNEGITNYTDAKRYIPDGVQDNETLINYPFGAKNSVVNLKADQKPSGPENASQLVVPGNEKLHSRSSSYHSTSSGDIPFFDTEYLKVSEISLQTKPLQGPPPSRPPPQLVKKPQHPDIIHVISRSEVEEESLLKHKVKIHLHSSSDATKIHALDESIKDHSCYYDTELAPSSAAAASAAAIKEAMEQAQARLKRAKELMDRKRDKQHHRKVGQPKVMNGRKDGAANEVELKSCTNVIAASNLLKENNSISECDFLEKKEIHTAEKTVLNLEEKKLQLHSSREDQQQVRQDSLFKSSEVFCKLYEMTSESKAEKKFYDLKRNGGSLNTVEDNYILGNEKKVKASIYAFQGKENDKEKGEQTLESTENKKLSEVSRTVEKLEIGNNLNDARMSCMKESDKTIVNAIMEEVLPMKDASKLEEAFGCNLIDENQKPSDVRDDTAENEVSKPNSVVDSCFLKENAKRLKASNIDFEIGVDEAFLGDREFRTAEGVSRNVDHKKEFYATHMNCGPNNSDKEFKVVNGSVLQIRFEEETRVLDGICISNPSDTKEVAEEIKPCNNNDDETKSMKHHLSHDLNRCKIEENFNAEVKKGDGLQTNEGTCISAEMAHEHEVIYHSNGLEKLKAQAKIKDAAIEQLTSRKETCCDYHNDKETKEAQMELQHNEEWMGECMNHVPQNFEFLTATDGDWAKGESENIAEVPVICNLRENKISSSLTDEVFQEVEIEKSDAAEVVLSRKDGNPPAMAVNATEVSHVEVSENSKHSLHTEEEENRKRMDTERERDKELAVQEEKEREREREKDRIAVERANHEARERALAEARERAERIAVERATSEARQRALAEAREKAEKAAEAEKISREARLRAERAAVERATEEARQRAIEKALAGKAASEAKSRMRKDNATLHFKAAYVKEDSETRKKFYSTEIPRNTVSAAAFANGQRCAESLSDGGTESDLRCKARQERQQRTAERAAKALAEKNKRDILAQREQSERDRLADSLDIEVRRWSSGKDGNLRALLSTLQYILGPDSGWQPIPLTDVITATAVKKAFRKATLCVHPDKLQQRGATIQQKYICEKVFDLLKDAWNKFNSEER